MMPYTAGIANSTYAHPIRCRRANLFFRITKMKIREMLFTIPRIKKNTSSILNPQLGRIFHFANSQRIHINVRGSYLLYPTIPFSLKPGVA